MLKISRTAGFTFTELLIALTINGFLFTALIFIFLAIMNHYRQTINNAQLSQQMQSALFLMSTEIRRAGYSATARNDIGLDQNTNPFVASGVDINVNASNNCILFAYDHDGNGTLPSVGSSGDDERYGFQLANNALQTRPPGASFSCGATDWENMTDPNVLQITGLTFSLTTSTVTTGPGARGIASRSVDISMTGNLTSNAAISKTLTQHVRLRNDRFIP